jgi:hypothetical protein
MFFFPIVFANEGIKTIRSAVRCVDKEEEEGREQIEHAAAD